MKICVSDGRNCWLKIEKIEVAFLNERPILHKVRKEGGKKNENFLPSLSVCDNEIKCQLYQSNEIAGTRNSLRFLATRIWPGQR